MELSHDMLNQYKKYLTDSEKSSSTIENYIRNIERFLCWAGDIEISKQKVIEYKEELIKKYKISTANAALSALNSFFEFCGYVQFKVKIFKKQKEIFYSEEKELKRKEYERLLKEAQKKRSKRLYCIMQTICSAGIRVSELRYITVEAVNRKYAEVRCKGKIRTVILSGNLCRLLKKYIADNKIKSGYIFLTKTGKPIHRITIWREMKNLCERAGVSKTKVFPHNLRHLFARIYYSAEKDIVRLADILGHSSVDTTRIYTMESSSVHRKHIERLNLVYTG